MICCNASARREFVPSVLSARLRAANVGGSYAIDALSDLAEAGELHSLTGCADAAYVTGAKVALAVSARVEAEMIENGLDVFHPYPFLPTARGTSLDVGWGRTGLRLEWDWRGPLLSAGWWESPDDEENPWEHPRILALTGPLPE
jgi:hypothetical protein